MKKCVIALILLMVAGYAFAAQLNIPVKENNRFKAGARALDIATSFDGKHVFILTEGQVKVFSSKGELEDSFPVDPAMTDISVIGYNLPSIENKIYLSSKKTGEVLEMKYDFIFSINTQGAPFLGLADAPVSIVVFSDFQ